MDQAITDPILTREMCFLVQSFIKRGGDKRAIVEARRLSSFNNAIVPFLIRRLLRQKRMQRRYDGSFRIEIEDLRRLGPMIFSRIAYNEFSLFRRVASPFDQTTIAMQFLMQDLRGCKQLLLCNQTAGTIADGLSGVIGRAIVRTPSHLRCCSEKELDEVIVMRDPKNLPPKEFILRLISLIVDHHPSILQEISRIYRRFPF
jgi:hypothetical protein